MAGKVIVGAGNEAPVSPRQLRAMELELGYKQMEMASLLKLHLGTYQRARNIGIKQPIYCERTRAIFREIGWNIPEDPNTMPRKLNRQNV